jgi:fatty-acyl-CoA synthase
LSQPNVDPDAPIMLLYTSGTTGRSKGAIVTARNAWAGALNFSFAFGVAPSDTLLCDMPMFHVASLGVARSALLIGARVLISDRFVASETLARLSDRSLNITHYFAVPQVATSMLHDPAFGQSDLSTLKALAVGGAPLPENVVREYLSREVPILNTYGVSEAMGTALAMPANCDLIERKPGSCGVPAMLIDVRLVGADQRDVEAGGVGEIWLRGPCITPGYWRQKEATAKAFEGEWLRTGDAATCDGDGFYRIVDRWKDMYISGGENIYPAEVEAVLSEHAAVSEVAVIGVSDDQWGEVGCAYIVLRPDSNISPEEVDAHCRSRIAAFKIPKHVRLVESLPRTASGKIQKGNLRQAFSERKE